MPDSRFKNFCKLCYLASYQGYVSAALVLGGVDVTGPHLHTVSWKLFDTLKFVVLWHAGFLFSFVFGWIINLQVYPHGSTDTLPFATMGSGSLAAMAVFESKYREGLTVSSLHLIFNYCYAMYIQEEPLLD